MLTIRNFNQRIECDSAKMTLETLQSFKGLSLSISYIAPSGLNRVIFVTVNLDGEVEDSYNATKIDLTYLTKIFMLELAQGKVNG
ncbi:hypothetical protein [Shewanella aestuarii]|uniref:Uncharacterized protein n=1 Tax=Shewanella aestuarii TaxID=1028752 RepID=A0A6G9QPD5_9GAMM|nr:hypothetical protein [Shewanella aestuarii]QIR16460.1 hypothetical protein HBH39_18485 [Shewanella aestuarii]